MKISEEEVRHVATLSKLSFSDSETKAFATDLTKIVEMVELLNEVDTEGVAITTTMADRKNVMRKDQHKLEQIEHYYLKMSLKKKITLSKYQLFWKMEEMPNVI